MEVINEAVAPREVGMVSKSMMYLLTHNQRNRLIMVRKDARRETAGEMPRKTKLLA